MNDDQILDGLAKARFGSMYDEVAGNSPRARTMRENVEWAVPYVKAMMSKAYRDNQEASTAASDKTPKDIICEQNMFYKLDLQMLGRARPLEDRVLEALDEAGYEIRKKP